MKNCDENAGWPPAGFILTGESCRRLKCSRPTLLMWVNKKARAIAEMNERLRAQDDAIHHVGAQAVAQFLGVSIPKVLELARRDDRLRSVGTDPGTGLPLFDKRERNLWQSLRIDLDAGQLSRS